MNPMALLVAVVIALPGCRCGEKAPSPAAVPGSHISDAKLPRVKLDSRSEAQAKAIATAYVAAKRPDLDVSHRPPVAQYFVENRSTMAGGKPYWAVTFAIPAPRDENGKIIGVRPYHGFTVCIDLAGQVVNCTVHSP